MFEKLKLTENFGDFSHRNARIVILDLLALLADEEKVTGHWSLWHSFNLGFLLLFSGFISPTVARSFSIFFLFLLFFLFDW